MVKNPKNKKCKFCGKTFTIGKNLHGNKRFCSASCRQHHYYLKNKKIMYKRNRVIVEEFKKGGTRRVCLYCGREFKRTRTFRNNLYCCFEHYKKSFKVFSSCRVCGSRINLGKNRKGLCAICRSLYCESLL